MFFPEMFIYPHPFRCIMNTTDYLHYDEQVDHLTIYKSDEKIASNVDTGLAILSFNKKREIVGIELMGAHANFHVPLEALNRIQASHVWSSGFF